MNALLLVSLFFSGITVLLLVGVAGHLRRTLKEGTGLWLHLMALALAFSTWAYIAHIFVSQPFWKTRLYAFIVLGDNLAAVLLLVTLFKFLDLWEERFRRLWVLAGLLITLLSLPPLFMPVTAFRFTTIDAFGHSFVVVDPTTHLTLTTPRVVVVWGLQLAALTWLLYRMYQAGLLHRSMWPLLALVGLALLIFNGSWLLTLFFGAQWHLPLMLPLCLLWLPVVLGLWALTIEGIGLMPPRFFYSLIHNTASGLLVYSWPQFQLLWWNARVLDWFPNHNGGNTPALPEALQAHLRAIQDTDGQTTLYLEVPQPRYLVAEIFSLPDQEHPVAKAVLLQDVTEEERARQHMSRHAWLTELRHRLLQVSLHSSSLQSFAQEALRLLIESTHEAYRPRSGALYWPSLLFTNEEGEPTLHLLATMPEGWSWRPQPPPMEGEHADWLPGSACLQEADPEIQVGILPLKWQTELRGYLALAFSRTSLPDPGLWSDFQREVGSILGFLLALAQERDVQTWMVRTFHALPIPLMVARVDGTALWVNPAFQAWIPTVYETGNPVLDRLLGQPIWQEMYTALQQGQEVWETQVTLTRTTEAGKKETRTFLLHASPIYTPQNRIEAVSIALYDVTEQEHLRQQIERQRWFLDRLMQAAVRLWQHLVSLHRLLAETIALIHEWYPEARVSLALFDRDVHGHIYVTTRMDDTGHIVPPGPFYYRALQESAVGWALRHQESVLISDVAQDSRWTGREMPEYPEVASAVLVPIFYRRQAMGVLMVGHPRPGAFDAWDQDLLESLAQWLALALQNARLYEEQRRIQRIYHDEQTRLQHLEQHLLQMLDHMAHEIRTPLHLMLGTLEMMQKRLSQNGDTQRVHERLVRYLQEIGDLVEVYLDRERLQHQSFPERVRFRVQDLVQEIQEIVQPLLERYQVRLVLEVHPEDLTMEQDRRRMLHLLLTLVEFAIRRAQTGQVHLRAFYDPERPVPGVVFWVLDTGPALSPEEARALFEPRQEWGPIGEQWPLAYRSEQPQLFLVQEYVERLHGQIQVLEMLGYGLVFWIWLPQRLPRAGEIPS